MKTKIIKKIFIALALHCTLSAFALDGLMSGEKNIRIVKTQWFDIIYSEDSKKTANILAEHADKIYGEVCTFLCTEQYARFPVVITPAQDEFNAYYSPAPYSHIVMYDTPAIKELAVFSEEFLSVFKHELTHAVSYMMKNKFWRGIGKIFGDVVNPAALFITQSHAEGVAVASESATGEGRLHDAYSLHTIRQAKIENKFPRYADIYGSRDIYPYSVHYYFGGAFVEFLQKEYGLEKYAQFWYKCVNFQTIHQVLAFKKIYGISVKSAWNQFIDSVYVPPLINSIYDSPSASTVNDNTLDNGTLLENLASENSALENSSYKKSYPICDFFSNNSKRSLKNSQGNIYSDLCVSEIGFYFREKKSGSLYFSKWNEQKKIYEKAKKIFSLPSATRTSVSSDGKYLAISFTSNAAAVPLARVKIVNIKNKSSFLLKDKSVNNACVVTWNDTRYLAVVKTKSQASTLSLYELTEKNNRIKGARLIAEKFFDFGDSLFSLNDAGNGSLAFLHKHKNAWSIKIFNIETKDTISYSIPDDSSSSNDKFNTTIRDLHVVHDFQKTESPLLNFTFSFANENTLPRFGKMTVSQQILEGEQIVKFSLQEKDISGGVFNPVVLATNEIAYAGEFFEDTRLFLTDNNFLTNKVVTLSKKVSDNTQENDWSQTEFSLNRKENDSDKSESDNKNSEDDNKNFESENFAFLQNSKKYNPLKFYSKGIFLPVSIARTHNPHTQEERTLPFGFTYASSNPWSSKLFLISAGYSIFSNSAALEFNFGLDAVPNGTETQVFNYNISNQVEFDRQGFKQTSHEFQFSSVIPVGNISHIIFKDNIFLFVGRSDKKFSDEIFRIEELFQKSWFTLLEDRQAQNRFVAKNIFYAGYSNIHKSGSGKYEDLGFTLYAAYSFAYHAPLWKDFANGKFYHGLGGKLTIKIPKLFPYSCKEKLTYNFPFKIESTAFLQADEFFTNTATVILFAGEVQKAIPLIYVNRYRIYATYTGRFLLPEYGSWNFLNTVELCKKLAHGNLNY
ncbi:MAG: hypothetical protein IJR49_04635, partial [Treponema sp.]|nr:hypothetical protein [Treponema sp.]